MKDEVLFTQQEWYYLVVPGYEGAKGDENMIQCLARVPNILQRCKGVLPSTSFMELKHEVESMRQNCKAIIEMLRNRLNTIDMDSVPTTLHAHIQAHYSCIYAMGLAMGIILNCLLGMLEVDRAQLCEDSSHYSDEIVRLAEPAVKYQPLGSAAMVPCLGVAWLGAPDSATKDRAKSMLYGYERACLGIPSSDLTADLERMTTRFTLK